MSETNFDEIKKEITQNNLYGAIERVSCQQFKQSGIAAEFQDSWLMKERALLTFIQKIYMFRFCIR